MKKQLRKGDYKTLNVYFQYEIGGNLGVCSIRPRFLKYTNSPSTATSPPPSPLALTISTTTAVQSSTLLFLGDQQLITTSAKPLRMKSAIGSAYFTRSRVAALALETVLPIRQLRHRLRADVPRGETHVLMQQVWIRSITIWITLMSECFLFSLASPCDWIHTDNSSSCYEEFTAGQNSRMLSMYNQYRAWRGESWWWELTK